MTTNDRKRRNEMTEPRFVTETSYEWCIETWDDYDDIIDHEHSDSTAAATGINEPGNPLCERSTPQQAIE